MQAQLATLRISLLKRGRPRLFQISRGAAETRRIRESDAQILNLPYKKLRASASPRELKNAWENA